MVVFSDDCTLVGGSLPAGRQACEKSVSSKIQRAFGLFQSPARNTMGVDRRSPDIGMTEKHLNRPYIIAGLQKVCGERVAKGVTADALGEFCPSHCFVKGRLDVRFMKMIPS